MACITDVAGLPPTAATPPFIPPMGFSPLRPYKPWGGINIYDPLPVTLVILSSLSCLTLASTLPLFYEHPHRQFVGCFPCQIPLYHPYFTSDSIPLCFFFSNVASRICCTNFAITPPPAPHLAVSHCIPSSLLRLNPISIHSCLLANVGVSCWISWPVSFLVLIFSIRSIGASVYVRLRSPTVLESAWF